MVDGDRPKWRAIDRNEQRMLSHRDISSRSERLSACLPRCRSGGRMPPVGEITEKTDEDCRSNRRPIELIGSPDCQSIQGIECSDAQQYMPIRYFRCSNPPCLIFIRLT